MAHNEPEQLSAAFTGADRVLLISSNDPRQSVIQHTAVIEAARQAGAGLLAYTSLWHADTSTLLTAVPHRLTEPIIRDSGVPYIFLRNNLYTDHYAPQIRQAAKTGIFAGSAGTGRVASATRADYAAAAVAVLTGNGHENKVYELGGDVAWSYAELAAVLSKVTGHEIAYQSIPPAKHHELLVAAGIPRMAADLFIDTYTSNNRFFTDVGCSSPASRRACTPDPAPSHRHARPPATRRPAAPTTRWPADSSRYPRGRAGNDPP